MQRVMSVRIVRWYLKLAYVAGVWLAGYPAFALFDALNAPQITGSVVNAVITLAGIILGARWFRGKGEPITPPRPWWKMTARRTLSRVVGVASILGSALTVLYLLGAALGVERWMQTLTAVALLEYVLTAVLYAIIATLYLNSAARLPKPAPRPRDLKLDRKTQLS